MTDEALIRVSGLEVDYRGGGLLRRRSFRAVNNVSFDIPAGKTIGLVGESGSGKSTIGRAILRLVPASAGSITFRGEEITSWGSSTPRRYRRAVQVVFQDPSTSLNPRKTIEHTLAEVVLFHHGLRGPALTQRVTELIDDVGLARHLTSRFPHELSGGQQQRVAIARALAPGPDVLVCDEAVSALDVSTQSQVINLLQDLQEEHGMSYLFISHDLGVVRHISDTVAVLLHGEIVEQGDADDVYLHPREQYTKALLDAIPTMHGSR